ncbi:hypothetical protein CDIK_1391 [Cucumispora dikerogammari]|nr:hypothetical protein CDIK_1391 [Cucumispora dikerogammari]
MHRVSLKERLTSFEQPNKFKKLPIEYALSGFILSEPDKGTLTCTFCNKALAGWDNEVPFQEHKAHPNNCPLLSLKTLESRKRTFTNSKLVFLSKQFFCYQVFDYDTVFCYKCGFYEHFPNGSADGDDTPVGLSSKLSNISLFDHPCNGDFEVFAEVFFFRPEFFFNILKNEPKFSADFDFEQLKEISHLLQYVPMGVHIQNLSLKEVLKKAKADFIKKIREKMIKDEQKI